MEDPLDSNVSLEGMRRGEGRGSGATRRGERIVISEFLGCTGDV